jgi:HEAT repeat protein
VIASAARPKLVEIDPRGWLLKEIDFEKADEEYLFQLEHAACVLGRLSAALALVKKAKTNAGVTKALAGAWKREKAAFTRHEMFAVLCNGEEAFRAAIVEGASDREPRVRVAAIEGLARLARNDQSEALLRAAWRDPKQPYGSRKAALRGLTGWKVKDASALLAEALKITAGDHTIAAEALDLMLAAPGTKARELAVLYSKYGQPQSLRSSAIGAFGRLAKEDPTLHDALVELSDDPDRSVRLRAWMMVRELKVKKALPVLEARLRSEHLGFGGFARETLEATINELKNEGSKPNRNVAPPTQAKTVAELEAQLADLQKKTNELTSQIADLKQKGDRKAQGPNNATSGASSGGSH